jgi:glutamine cyclotransferase
MSKAANRYSRWIIYAAVAAVTLITVLILGRDSLRRGPLRPGGAPVHTYRVLNAYPHDPGAFTQGLVYENGFLYEGTGLRGHSSLRQVELESGQVIRIHRLPERVFGEGIAIYGDRIVQLTLRSKKAFVYDKATFRVESEFTYSGQGWGLTFDGQNFIMSDGTSALYFFEPGSFTRVGQVIVKDRGRPVMGLNELEYMKGEVLANVWRTDLVARISPVTGKVEAWIDLAGLLDRAGSSDTTDVLNGIAYDAESDRLFVTGKLWPSLFEIEIIEP